MLTYVLTIAVILRALLSWFPIDPYNPLAQFLIQITEPILAPIRQVVPRFGMIDLTPMVAIILLQLIGTAVARGIS